MVSCVYFHILLLLHWPHPSSKASNRKANQTMADRRERCSHCGILLIVPPEAHTIKCAVCHGITRIGQAIDPLSLAYKSVSQAANRLRGYLNTIITGSVNSNMGYGTPHYGNYYYPQPQSPSVPPSAYGSKRAVLCGICYHGERYKLKGSVTDVKCMTYLLVNQWGFPRDSILVLTGNNSDILNGFAHLQHKNKWVGLFFFWTHLEVGNLNLS